ncbi:cobyrinate a,c-diamide synthase [Maribrevibacterium harenarium]|uniref:Cobyrinate a,c-diamide synthase n=1 Tax=Maribrevibacterium harenarium TaxID=2589817 RepID=A0A501X2G4_9GAMM|nr:cobyrinate a,c-diamide synthase [Maribrevibacterium harenarium]TPE54643.1 cobyrinate a,c-diamide synthase [Maribrevibacterium harenarium]
MSSDQVLCPALFLAAPASGQGKTTITAVLARYFCSQGKRVTVFKTGPDYLDPQILAQASGRPVEQLDIWMAGEHYCRQRLYEAALCSDLILVEGVMGMFDGTPSSADLAALFGIPIAIVMDVGGMAQTAAALVHGMATFREDIKIAGLIANRCGSDYHASLIADALPSDIPLLAALSREERVRLPERHLGLVQAAEMRDELEEKLVESLTWLHQPRNAPLLTLPEPVLFRADLKGQIKVGQHLSGKTIAIARDEAFSFAYAANILLLQQLGATIEYFSPLRDSQLPQSVDALWLPGGYPELHADELAKNQSMKKEILAFYLSEKPILAECGGMMYCLDHLHTLDGISYEMLGLISGEGIMRDKGGCQGMQTAMLPEGVVRAHSHHRSMTQGTPDPIAYGKRQRHSAPGEEIFRCKGLTATYLHLFFPSNPEAIAAIFSK